MVLANTFLKNISGPGVSQEERSVPVIHSYEYEYEYEYDYEYEYEYEHVRTSNLVTNSTRHPTETKRNRTNTPSQQTLATQNF